MPDSVFDTPEVAKAISLIEENALALAVLRDERTVYTSKSPGIRAALALHDRNPEWLSGAVIVDRIIGRAAAMIFLDGGAAAVYGSVMNRQAMAELTSKGVRVRAGTLVDTIINRRGDGPCPMEETVKGITDPAVGIPALRQTVRRLMEASL